MDSDGPGWSDFLGLGVTAAGVLIAGFALGWLVDHLAGTFPLFVFIGLLLGIIGAITYTVVRFRTYLRS